MVMTWKLLQLFLEKNHNLKTYMTTYRVTKNKERNNNLKKIAEALEQNQLPQLSEHEICSRSDESNQPLTSKTAKAAEVVLGKTPEVIQLEKLCNNLNRSPKSRYCANRYENHLEKIQVLVLKATR